MAEARDTLDVSDLKETFLECAICLEHFDQAERRPRLLVSCLHAFCTKCLEQLLKKERGQVTCPNCRHVQKVNGNAQSLPVDPVRNKLVDYVQFKKDKKIPCTDCPDGSHAVARCHDCQIYMCKCCKEAHHRNRPTRKHICQSLEEALAEPVKNFLSHFCRDHPDHKIEFYCGKCSSLCCVSCSIVKHKGHDLDPIEDSANSMLSSLKNKLKDVEKSASVLRRKKISLDQASNQHELNLKQTTLSINQTFEELNRKLKLRQNKLIAELQERTDSTVNSLKKQHQATEDGLAKMESALEYFKQIETKSDDCEVLSAGPVLVQSLEAAAAVEPTQDVQHLTLTFSPGEMTNIISNVNTYGGIHSSTNIADEGAFEGRSLGLTVPDAGVNYRRDRDLEYSSFTSTFTGDASLLRDLDEHQSLPSIEKWVEDTWKQSDIPSHAERGTKWRKFRASDFADETKNLEFNLPGGIVAKVHYGDIVKIRTDGIVNADYTELQNYAGVAGAIERACGRNLTKECERHIQLNGPLNVSEVMHTTSGDLIALGTSYILHTVGPVYVESLKSKCGNLLTCTFLRCLDYARKKLRIRSVAFPFISTTGIYGVPLDQCVESFLDAVVMYAKKQQNDTNVREIHLMDTDLETVQTAIVMIKQQLEEGFEVLASKAMSRLERKSNSQRSPQNEEKSPKQSSLKRSSSFSRITTKKSERS